MLSVYANFYRYLGIKHRDASLVDYHWRLELYIHVLGHLLWRLYGRVGKKSHIRHLGVSDYERLGCKLIALVSPVGEGRPYASKHYPVAADLCRLLLHP